ncbi:MAG TPA: VWA domain-containing protein [Candidatus Polarisedimenticolia bacterium]|nr:VWA domain-containing protein [Candidatus Polarisedimenticolia bacterium]
MRRLPSLNHVPAWLLLAAAAAVPAALPAGQEDETHRVPETESVQVNLVLIDVVVRDRKEVPVTGLRWEDFELLVDRLPAAPGDIETFEETCPPQPSATVQAGTGREGAVAAPAPSGEPLETKHIVILLDFSHMTMSGRRQALRSTRDFLSRGLGPADRVMLLAHKGGLRLVQDFTSSPSLLIARIDDLIPDTASLETEVLEESHKLINIARVPCDPAGECSSRKSLATVYATEEEMRARRTIEAVEDLMPALAGIDGRKALVVFSDVLRDEPGVQFMAAAGSTPQSAGIDIKAELLRLTREANAASVSLYTVHAGGLDDSTIAAFRDGGLGSTSPSAEPRGFQSSLYDAAQAGLQSALSLQSSLALETGGRALQRTNDLSAVLSAAQQDLRCHYVIGYRHPGKADNARHSLIVRLKPGPDGKERRGVTIRHRPYFVDYAASDRRERLVRSALDVPQLFRSIPIDGEAFLLAPTRWGHQVLVKATVPLESLSLLPAGSGAREGLVNVRGELSGGAGRSECSFATEVPIRLPGTGPEAARLIFETGCTVVPGRYRLSIVVHDATSREVGAIALPLVVPAGHKPGGAFLSDVHLWVRDPAALVVAHAAERIGLKDGTIVGGRGAYVPQGERRLAKDQQGMLSLLICPPDRAAASPEKPIRIRRRVLGAEDATVAEFRDLNITEPPVDPGGCYQIFDEIPASTLGEGVYTLSIDVHWPAFGSPLSRQAAFAVQ